MYWVIFACTAVCGWPATAASAGNLASPTISIQSNGHIRVLAHEVPISDVIESLQYTLGGELEIYDSVPNTQTLSADCSSADVIELISCVFSRDTSYILQTSRGAEYMPSTRVWILPRGAMSKAASSKHTNAPSSVTDIAHANFVSMRADKDTSGKRERQDNAPHTRVHIASGASSKQPVQRQTSTYDPTFELLTDADVDQLVAMTRADDAEQRAQALTRLAAGGSDNDAAVRQALEVALTDYDPAVRAQAISGIALRDGDAAYPVLQRAIVDYDVSVRLVALDSAPQNSLGHALLEIALNDTDASVRSLAAAKVQEWEYCP